MTKSYNSKTHKLRRQQRMIYTLFMMEGGVTKHLMLCRRCCIDCPRHGRPESIVKGECDYEKMTQADSATSEFVSFIVSYS